MDAFGQRGGGGRGGGRGGRGGGGRGGFVGGRGGGGGGWGGGGHHHHHHHGRGGFARGAWRGYWGRPYYYDYPWYEETPTYFVRSRIGGKAWADDVGYTWAEALRVAAARAATTPPQGPGDFIQIMLANGTAACAWTAVAGRWSSSCGDIGFGAADADPSAGTWLAVGAVAVGLYLFFQPGARSIWS